MKLQEEQLAELKHIRSIMERSTRFIGLSGFSGVAAGLCALIGATVLYVYLNAYPFEGDYVNYLKATQTNKWGVSYRTFIFLDGTLTALCAFLFGVYFTMRKSNNAGQSIFTRTALRLLFHLAVPLLTGGIFCFALLYYGLLAIVPATTLIFYGLALVNGSKFTLHEVQYLGFSEIILGLIALFIVDYSIELWAIGFGFLHILYGVLMYNKYERSEHD